MKSIFSFLFFLICFQHISYSQCDEYYINELRGGNEGNCKYNSGAKLSFCPNSNTISIDAANGRQTFKIIKTDFPDKSTFGTQLFTLAQGGGQVGMAKLIMEDKTFGMQINGCGGSRTYNISLSKSEYNEWVKGKPKREAERKKEEAEASALLEIEARAEKMRRDYNLTKEVDKSYTDSLLENNRLFQILLSLSKKDTVIIEFNGKGKITAESFNFLKDIKNVFCDNLDSHEYYSKKMWDKNEYCKSDYRIKYNLDNKYLRDTIIDGIIVAFNHRMTLVKEESEKTASFVTNKDEGPYYWKWKKYQGRAEYVQIAPGMEKFSKKACTLTENMTVHTALKTVFDITIKELKQWQSEYVQSQNRVEWAPEGVSAVAYWSNVTCHIIKYNGIRTSVNLSGYRIELIDEDASGNRCNILGRGGRYRFG